MVAGHSGQFTPGGYLSTVIHTTLAGIEPTTFRLLVRRTTSRATETKEDNKQWNEWAVIYSRHHTYVTSAVFIANPCDAALPHYTSNLWHKEADKASLDRNYVHDL